MSSTTRMRTWPDRQSANASSDPVSPIASSPYNSPMQSAPMRGASPVSPLTSQPPVLPPIKRVSSTFKHDWRPSAVAQNEPIFDANSASQRYDTQAGDDDGNERHFSAPLGLAIRGHGDTSSFAQVQALSMQDSYQGQSFHPSTQRSHQTSTEFKEPNEYRESPRSFGSASSEPFLASSGRSYLPSERSPQNVLASSVIHAVPYSATTASTQPTLGGKPLKFSDSPTIQNGIVSHTRSGSPRRIDQPASKTGKKGLALLNPVHLLMRRRSTQPSPDSTTAPVVMANATSLPSLTSDYDPSIRGNRVVDFSSPRRQTSASSIPTMVPSLQTQPPVPAMTPQREHCSSPPKPPFPHVPSSQSNAPAYEHNMQLETRNLHASNSHGQSPPFSRSTEVDQQYPFSRPWHHAPNAMPVSQPSQPEQSYDFSQPWQFPDSEQHDISRSGPRSAASPSQSSAANRPSQAGAAVSPGDQARSPSLHDTASSHVSGSHSTRSCTTAATPDSGLPRHFKSNASRFSFQMAGQDSIMEERLLEEKAKDRKSSAPKSDDGDDDEDFFDENAMYDQDELEENAAQSELPDESSRIGTLSSPAQPTAAPRHAARMHDDDDDDDMYFHDGVIDLNASTHMDDGERLDENKFDDPHFLANDNARPRIENGNTLGKIRDSIISDHDARVHNVAAQGQPSLLPSNQDPTNETAAYQDALVRAAQKAAANGRFDRRGSNISSDSSYSEPPTRRKSVEIITDNSYTPADGLLSQPAAPNEDCGGAAYSGFDFGFDPSRSHRPSTDLSSMMPDAQHAMSPADYQGVYDDDLYHANDDDIISEANADALASDDDGFYSQEFGFYARARTGSFEEDAINGGYFGEPGIDGIERKWSIREPNLTPITERSEFSTRNSVAGGPRSPAFGPTSNPSFASGQHLSRNSPMASLAQLQQEELSLDRLLHIRSQSFNSDVAGRRTESMSSLSSVGLAQLRAMNTTPDAGARGTAAVNMQYGSMAGEDRGSPTRSHLGSSRLAYQDYPEPRFESELHDGMQAPPDAYSTPKKTSLNPARSPQAPLTAFKTSPVKHRGHMRSDSSERYDSRYEGSSLT